jgi:hypothetical protein
LREDGFTSSVISDFSRHPSAIEESLRIEEVHIPLVSGFWSHTQFESPSQCGRCSPRWTLSRRAALCIKVHSGNLNSLSIFYWTARKSFIGRSGGSDTIIFLDSPLVAIVGTLPLWLIEIEKSMNPLRRVRSLSEFSVLRLVSLYSYHVREVLVCWPLFTAVFAAVAVLVLTGAPASYAGKYAIHCATAPGAPVAGLGPDEPYLKTAPHSIKLK